jgi:hypothetical protein
MVIVMQGDLWKGPQFCLASVNSLVKTDGNGQSCFLFVSKSKHSLRRWCLAVAALRRRIQFSKVDYPKVDYPKVGSKTEALSAALTEGQPL